MNSHDFEQELKRRPIRSIPPKWKRQVLNTESVILPSKPSWSARLWELLRPSPVAWGTLAAAWIAIIGLRAATIETQEVKPIDYAQLQLALQLKRSLAAEGDEFAYPSSADRPRSDASFKPTSA